MLVCKLFRIMVENIYWYIYIVIYTYFQSSENLKTKRIRYNL